MDRMTDDDECPRCKWTVIDGIPCERCGNEDHLLPEPESIRINLAADEADRKLSCGLCGYATDDDRAYREHLHRLNQETQQWETIKPDQEPRTGGVYPFDISLDRIDENGAQTVGGKWWPNDQAEALLAAERERDAALTDVARLRPYVRHFATCSRDATMNAPCTCGLSNALKEAPRDA